MVITALEVAEEDDHTYIVKLINDHAENELLVAKQRLSLGRGLHSDIGPERLGDLSEMIHKYMPNRIPYKVYQDMMDREYKARNKKTEY